MKSKIGTAAGKGFINGVYADYATNSNKAQTAKDYEEGGTIDEKFKEFDKRTTDFKCIEGSVNITGIGIPTPSLNILKRRGPYVIGSIGMLLGSEVLDLYEGKPIGTLPEEFKASTETNAIQYGTGFAVVMNTLDKDTIYYFGVEIKDTAIKLKRVLSSSGTHIDGMSRPFEITFAYEAALITEEVSDEQT